MIPTRYALALAAPILLAAPATAATPRDIIVQAAFLTTDKAQALALVNQALAAANAQLGADPGDREARLQQAFATGYHAKLTRSPGEAKASRRLFEALVASNPRDPEAQLGLGGWHLDAIAEGFLATSVLGAKRPLGLAGVDQAVALGGNRVLFKALAAMMRIRLDPRDVSSARALAEAASTGTQPTALDRIAKREVDALLVPLRAGDGAAAAAAARRLLPFGRIG